MMYMKRFDAATFPWWGGAVAAVREVREAGKLDALTRHIEDVFGDGEAPSEADVNDYVWHEYCSVEESLKIGDFAEEEEE